MVTKNFTLRTHEDSLTSKYILYLLRQKNFLRGKNFKNFEGLFACLVIHDATSLIKLLRILKLKKKLKQFMLINGALVTKYTLAIK